jgi:hypothetical protein
MHYTDNVVVDILTDTELDHLIASLHTLDHTFTDREVKLLHSAETELESRKEVIIVIGWDEDEELETLY